MPGGRPLKFKSVKELQKKCDAYFDSCWAEVNGVKTQTKPYLITGLALALKSSRQTVLNYECKPEFLDTIKEAKLKCECYAEEMALTGKNQAGAIFALKNYEWKDKQELAHDGDITINIIRKVIDK